ncbi:hypothetical protein LQF12_13730 [Ruania suaedae]|uniref:hypothetical protein n=1 Tax=Ruania suaedae TaxID=2897774 RepID=UPI001E296563|nr:hypothetical protein [Ruania suaedae]UFU02539.1 hypothetical protein LQF12_13730 [Ruania suaedae]
MMVSGRTDEFTLDGEGPPGTAAPGEPRRRGPARTAGSPWPWVAAAMALLAAGVVVSPGGERPAAGPPPAAWTREVPAGRAPSVWVSGERTLVASATSVSGLEAATGEDLWSVPLDDPACTEQAGQLTCVHGEGEDAVIATVTAEGDVSERPFPGASVAHAAGDALLVAGLTESGVPFVDRYEEGVAQRTWRTALDQPFGEHPFGRATVSQGVATFYRTLSDPYPFLAVEVATGEQQPTVILTPRGRMVGMNDGVESGDLQIVPVPGPGLDLPDHPDAVVTTSGVTTPGGEMEYASVSGTIVAALGQDVLEWGFAPPDAPYDPASPPTGLPGTLARVDVFGRGRSWSTPTDGILGCPCAVSENTAALLTSRWVQDSDQPDLEPYAIHGFDLGDGSTRWSIPLTTAPDGVAAGPDHLYVLSEGTLTAYVDR